MTIYHLNTPVRPELLPENPRILYCNFASGIYGVSKRERLISLFSNKEHANLSKFHRQVARCNVIVFNGGHTPLLIDALRLDLSWVREMKNKTVFAMSAGVSALMRRSYNVDMNIILEGIGLLPFQSVVHYNMSKLWMVVGLESTSPLPVLPIWDNMEYTYDDETEKLTSRRIYYASLFEDLDWDAVPR